MTEVRDTPDGRGKGLYATRKFRKDEVIGEFFGEPITRDELIERYGSGLAEYVVQIGEDTFLDDWKKLCPLSFSNDAVSLRLMKARWLDGMSYKDAYNMSTNKIKRNSCMSLHDGRLFFIATRDIEPDEEILWSYGWGYWADCFSDTVPKPRRFRERARPEDSRKKRRHDPEIESASKRERHH